MFSHFDNTPEFDKQTHSAHMIKSRPWNQINDMNQHIVCSGASASAELHVLNDEYTSQWQTQCFINWLVDSSVLAKLLTNCITKMCRLHLNIESRTVNREKNSVKLIGNCAYWL